MPNFSVDVEKMISSSQEIMKVSSRLKKLSSQVLQLNISEYIEGSAGSTLEKALKNALSNASDEAAKLDSFGEALEAIAQSYRKTELSLLNNWNDYFIENDSGSVEAAEKKKSLLRRFWDWLTNKKPDDYVAPTDEQEKAADLRMRQEIWAVLQNEKYSRESWEKASIKERKQILQDYMDELVVIYGLQHVKSDIKWKKDTYTQMSVTFGSYNPNTHKVYINEKVLTDKIDTWDSYELMGTIAHELRHAYQHEAVKNPEDFTVSQETLDSWSKNFKHYINASKDYNGYRNQPIEKDARSFEVDRNVEPSM